MTGILVLLFYLLCVWLNTSNEILIFNVNMNNYLFYTNHLKKNINLINSVNENTF